MIVVDGFRGDFLNRYAGSFGDDGFRRLIDNGVWYTNAHHLHANTETVVGHATLVTGAHPSEHGMIGNAWFDRASGDLGYNIEDRKHPLLEVPGFAGEGDQVDPAQAIAKASGRSPANLLTSTFADELSKANNGRSKVFGISGKDRSAVMLAGHVGKALWMSTNTGAFETSTYYYDDYPAWVSSFNDERLADRAIGAEWELSDPIETYSLADNDDRPYEVDLKGFGRTFPHVFSPPESGLYYTQLLLSPIGDELTAELAKAAIRAEKLGQDNAPDVLGVSFAGVDATNHFFGPSSLENEEMVRRLDRTLAAFFSFIDEEVGKERVLYVLSADHGMPEMPEFMAEKGFSTERLYANDIKDQLNAEIEKKFGFKAAIKEFFRPYIYLNHLVITEADVEIRAIEKAIVESLMTRDGIAMAMPRVPFGDQIDNALDAPIRRNLHAKRSGDIYVAQAPYSFLFERGPIGVMHGSPWAYDSHVPILFAGAGIEPSRVSRKVATVDVAVTLANMFGTTLPSGAAGDVLLEVVD